MAARTYLNTALTISVFFVVLAFSGTVHAKIIYVDDDGPADFSNIQAAIDDSNDGDIIIANPGTYTGDGNRDIDFVGKAITVRSLNGPETCIINCEGTESESHRGFYFHSGEGTDSVLSGLTITNGYAPKRQIGKYIRMLGGAIYCDYSSPVITNCIFRENISGWKGGAIMSSGCKPKIINCLFQNNVAQWGGGLHTSAVYGSSQGPIMTNCTFVDNFANNRSGGGGVYCDSTGKTTLTNCILWGNTSQGGGVYGAQVHLPNPVVSYCCIEGSFGSTPLLAPDGYHLLAGSPCIDAGDPNYIAEPDEKDLDGKPRIIGGRIDMGAYEYQPRILYVDDDATGKNDGSSWADAYNYLQDALSAAWRGDEIRVAQGIYTPDSNSTEPNGSGDRTATFQLINDVILKGGYTGFGAPDPNARDIQFYETILSGDLLGNDGADFANNAENSYHIVTASATNETAILDGFTITAGNANGQSYPTQCGGGIYNIWSNPILINCTLIGNTASENGGGIHNHRSNPTLANSIFSRNSATHGGGVTNYSGSTVAVANCTFVGNSAVNGKALACDSRDQKYASDVDVTNCILWEGGNEIWNNDGSTITVNYSDIQGSWPGEGNIGAKPCFVDLGYWDANGVWVEGDYHLLPDSPCIDAGDPNYIAEPKETDLDGRPRIIGGRIDMGAYEYSPPILAEAKIVPRTINLASKGKSITCYIWLPEDYNVTDIDTNSIVLENGIEPDEFSVNEERQVAVLRFSREELQAILTVGDIELKITGQLYDGTQFEGTDTIKVIDKAGKN